jgi:hypothetical protein
MSEERSKSILEIVLMPLVIAVVGTVGTLFITSVQNRSTQQLTEAQIASAQQVAIAQLEQAKQQSDSSQQLKLLEIFGEKITSSNPADKELAVRLLSLVDPVLGKKLTEITINLESTPEEVRRLASIELQQRIQLGATASPPTVGPGDKTSISIVVQDAKGTPLQNAAVKVMAGGGKFLRSNDEPYDPTGILQGPYSASGPTDNAGRFTTWWVCKPCAPAYGLSVEATKQGYVAGQADLTINIR